MKKKLFPAFRSSSAAQLTLLWPSTPGMRPSISVFRLSAAIRPCPRPSGHYCDGSSLFRPFSALISALTFTRWALGGAAELRPGPQWILIGTTRYGALRRRVGLFGREIDGLAAFLCLCRGCGWLWLDLIVVLYVGTQRCPKSFVWLDLYILFLLLGL